MSSRRAPKLLVIAQLAYAHWFFGNVYEAVVRIPDRLASEDQRLESLLGRGSPVRYYLPGIPVIVAATVASVAGGWKSRGDRPWLLALGSAAAVGMGLTVYVVETVNRRIFVAGHPVTPTERERLLRVWYRVNFVRIVASGAAWLIAGRLAR
jgi:hypothetical protein